MPPLQDNKHSRRAFLQAAFTAVATSSCTGKKELVITEAQKALRYSGISSLAIVTCKSYDENIFQKIRPFLPQLQLPDLKGKSVVIKPNMVDFRPNKPLTTNPAVIASAVELAAFLGAANIVVADGPALHRDTEFLLSTSGIGAMCKKLSVPFVDLNLDDLEAVENANGFTTLKHFFLPKTVVQADCLISLPKLKTHHWAYLTCSMKNLFGVVPGRKYGWPKNLLHNIGLDKAIVDVVRLAKPSFALVDAIVSMEGEGPLNGTAKDTGYLILGKDVAAVDATAARCMEVDPDKISYLKIAGQVIGNIKPDRINIVGSSLVSVAKSFQMPATYYNAELKGSENSQAT